MATHEIHNFIDGSFARDGRRDTFVNRSPVHGAPVSIVHSATKEDVGRAVQAAKRALQGPWGRTTMDERAQLLYAIAEEMDRRFEDFLAAEVADTGKPHVLASRVDIPRGAANFKAFADIIRVYSSEFFQTQRPGVDAINYSVRVPKGVVGVICPWNLPLLLMTWKVAPALASGNTVVVKPSEETPSTANLLAEVLRDVGVPDGVYNVVHGFGPEATGQWLCEHPDVDAITFTGETATGAAIMKSAANGIRDVSFELGGKNAGLVFADCDLDAALEGTVRSVFENCGQICLQTERLYVERPIFEEFVARMVRGA
ncbi:MAG: aldehyde dehydrogenase family protein, partial [Myxococcota bacterium]